jgi:peroxiredoxin
MRKLLYLGLAVLTAATAIGQEFKLGSPVADFKLSEVNGRQVDFMDLKGDLTVVTFIATQCPVSNSYNDRMKAVYSDYISKGVKFIFVNSNNTEPAAEVASHAAKNGFPFAVYKDPQNVVADRFGAQVTPEAFLIDSTGVIRYHGSIDDSQNPANIKTQGLRLALDAMLSGRTVEKAESKAFGCAIKRVRRAS